MTSASSPIEDLLRDLKAEILKTIKDSTVPVRYMNLKQAATYSGIGQKKLIELAQNGHIKGKKRDDIERGDWSFDRKSIDKYWHQPFEERRVEAKRILDRARRKRINV